MKVSLNWVKQFIDVALDVDELVEKIGAQLGAVEEVIDLGKKYEGIVIAMVVACEKHPDADKLRVCTIDDGGNTPNVKRDAKGHIQVVCGAPNVREGMLVAWIPPGATIPATADKDPLVLEAREIRGVVSNGMLASASELSISDDHSGLLEIDIELEPGIAFAEAYELDDYIIDIENKMFTHRPDLFGILGVAREIAGIQNIAFQSPDWYLQPLDRIKPGKSTLPLEVRNEVQELAPRFTAIAMADVSVKPSPLIIQTYLSRVGLRPINNIVDATNYLMVLTGQPLHAYDADKLKAQSPKSPVLSLEVRKSRKGDKLKLLSGKEVTFDDDNTVLITSHDIPVGIGGVMGGADTEVDENTKNIILECANFDMYSIRRTAMKYGLFTDAVTRFTKGQSSLQNDILLEEAVATAQYVSGAHVASEVFDLKGKISIPKPVEVTSEFINARLGLDISAQEMTEHLRNVEFEVEVSGETLRIAPPFWRTDIEIPEDIVEEVGRLIGYDHLPLELPKRSIKPAARNAQLDLKSSVRDYLSRAGTNEVLTYSFVHGDLLAKVGQDKDKAFQLNNALSPDLQYYRLSLTPSLLEKVHPNIKAGFGEFAVFEIGKKHQKHDVDEEKLPAESDVLAFVFATDEKSGKHHTEAAFYEAKTYLTWLINKISESANVKFVGVNDHNKFKADLPEWLKPFDKSRSALAFLNDEVIGAVGEYNAQVKRDLKLPSFIAGFEIDLSYLQGAKRSSYRPLSRFPKVQQDMTLRVPAELSFGELDQATGKATDKTIDTKKNQVGRSCLDIYKKEGDKHKNVTYRFEVASYERTLTDKEVNKLLDDIAAEVSKKLGAKRI